MADATPDDQLLAKTLSLCQPGEKEHEQRVRRYDQAYEVWRVRAKQDTLPKWRSRVKVPYAQASIDTALVNVVAGIPRCIVKPRRPQDIHSARAMQQVMDYFTGEAHLAEPQVVFAQQGLIFGVTVAKNHWVYEEQTRMIRQFQADGNGQTRDKPSPKKLVTRDGPCFEPWSVYDCWWDPNARDVDSARYIVLRFYATKDELQRKAYNDDSGLGLYKNLDKLFETGAGAQRQQTAQETYLGNAQNKRKDAFEMLEIWTDDRLVVIGNRKVIVRDEPNPYWHGSKPIVIAQTRPDLFEMQGVPETDLLADIQAAMHTLQNMTIDSLHLTVMTGFTYREGSVVDPSMLALRPNFKWPVGDHGDIQPVTMPQLDRTVYEERTRLLSDMERVTGISAYVSGADSGTIDQTTATGVTALQSAANTLLKFKAQQIHHKGFQRTFEQWGEMIQQFLDKPLWVEITGEDQIKQLQQSGIQTEAGASRDSAWWQITPQDAIGHYRYVLEGTEESLSQQQARNDAIGLLNALTPLVQLQKVNPGPLVEKVAAAFGILDPSSLVAEPPPQLPPAAPNGNGNGNGNQLPGAQDPLALMGGQSMPIPVQNAIAAR